MKSFFVFILIVSLVPVSSANARDREEKIIQKMDEDTWFKGSASYPNKLNPALTPLLHCELRRAGSTVTMNNQTVDGPSEKSECEELRKNAALMVNEILDREGIAEGEARDRIVKRAFGAVDALAASQRIWRAANQ